MTGPGLAVHAAIDIHAGDTTRERLLHVAETLLLDHGVDEVSLRTIVREAGQGNESSWKERESGT